MIKKIKKALTIGCILASLYTPIFGKDNSKQKKLEFGYNALETAVTQEYDVRNRLLSNIKLNLKPIYIGYHGLNETNNVAPSTYFGRNTLYAGKQGSKTAAAIVVKANKDGIFDKKIGIRQSHGAGWIDLTFDKESANLTGYYGRDLGKGLLLEVIHAIEAPYRGKAGHYTELQLNKQIFPKVYIFIRGEFNHFKIATAMFGFTKQF